MDNKSAALIDEAISILSTIWFPSPEEASAIKSRTIAQREMIKQIDEEIGVLRERHHALVMACDVGSAIIAPIRKLPVELLTDIFAKCIPPLPSRSRALGPGPQVPPQDVGELLGTVCRAWHTVVNDEPRIWSTVVLNREIQAPEDINQLLKKSKSHPLDIFIEPGYWFPTDDHEEHYDVIFAMLRSELWHTRTFIADMSSLRGAEPLFPQGFSINAPMMQTFSHVSWTPPVEHDLDTFHGPRLCSIILHFSQNLVRSLVANPVQTVRHLEVKYFRSSTALFLQLLNVLPNLVSLHWQGTDDTEEMQEAPPTVVLRSLKSLRLHIIDESVIGLLSFLHVPSLECLELITTPDFSMVHQIIDTLCGDGVVKLRHLHIFQKRMLSDYGDVGVMLGQLGCLETLIIEHSTILHDLLTALSPQHRDFSSVCPQLTTLVMLDSEIPGGPFVDFVHRRTRADLEEAVPGLVTSLKLHVTRRRSRSSYQLCMDFAETHSTTIHIMSGHEYVDASLMHI